MQRLSQTLADKHIQKITSKHIPAQTCRAPEKTTTPATCRAPVGNHRPTKMNEAPTHKKRMRQSKPHLNSTKHNQRIQNTKEEDDINWEPRLSAGSLGPSRPRQAQAGNPGVEVQLLRGSKVGPWSPIFASQKSSPCLASKCHRSAPNLGPYPLAIISRNMGPQHIGDDIAPST